MTTKNDIIAPGDAGDSDTTTREQYRRLFQAACEDLGLINEALGLDPDDGGAAPILAAIEELRVQQPADAAALRLLVAAGNRLDAEAEEFDGPDGMAISIDLNYWDEFELALERARAALQPAAPLGSMSSPHASAGGPGQPTPMPASSGDTVDLPRQSLAVATRHQCGNTAWRAELRDEEDRLVIGAPWRPSRQAATSDGWEIKREMLRAIACSQPIPAQWALTLPEARALAGEIVAGAEMMGADDDEPAVLQVRLAGTVLDDDGKPNARAILAWQMDGDPGEGVYPIDPTEIQAQPPASQACPDNVCQAAQADGVLCANSECDRESGVRAAFARVEPVAWMYEFQGVKNVIFHDPTETERYHGHPLSTPLYAHPPRAQATPVAWFIDWPGEPELGHYLSEAPVNAENGRCRALVFASQPAPAAQTSATQAISTWVADDAAAASFQSLGQYRNALLQVIRDAHQHQGGAA